MAYQGQQHGHATNGVDQYGNPVAAPAATGVMGAPGVAPAVVGAGTGGQFQPAKEGHKTGTGILHRSGSSSSSSSSEDDGMGGRRKKGIKEKIKEKLPGGRKGQQQNMAAATGGTYGQPGPAGITGTGAHGTTTAPGAGGAYGLPAPAEPAGMTGAGAHGTMATGGEKKGMKDKIMEKLPGGYKAEQHTIPTAGVHGGHAGMTGTGTQGNTTTGSAYGQQGHTGVASTGAHGTTGTGGGVYGGQQGHTTGVVGTGAHAANGTGQKKGMMGKIKEKLPGQH